MKYFKLLLCAITIVSVSACSSDDDSGDNGSGSANVIFTVDGVEYRFGNGVFTVGMGLNTLDARQNQNNRISVVVDDVDTGTDAISIIFLTLDGTQYLNDEGNVTVNSDTRLEGTFQGVFENPISNSTITVTNGTFSIDK